MLIACLSGCCLTIDHHAWDSLLFASVIKHGHSLAVLLSRRNYWDSYLVHVKVFRNLFEYIFVKTAEHVLKDCLHLDLNPLSNSEAPSNFLRKCAERCDFVVVHEISVLHECLIVSAQVVLKSWREKKEVRFVAPSNWVHRIIPSAHVVINVYECSLPVAVSVGHREGLHSAFQVDHTAEVFDRGWC